MATLEFDEGPRVPKRELSRKQLLPHVVDGMAAVRPYAVYAEYPTLPDSYAGGFTKLTYSGFANAINGLAWWIEDHLGHGSDFETLSYFGPNDFRYNALTLAACKAGYKILFCSPRNTVAGYKNLFDAMSVKTVLAAGPPYTPIVETLMDAYPLSLQVIPTIEELVNQKYPHYPYEKRFAEAHNEPLMVLHTSGTTALPKPIVVTHDWVASFVRLVQMEAPSGTESLNRLHHGNKMLVMMPPFHAGSFMPTLFDAVFNQTTIVFPLPNAILSPDHFQSHFAACVEQTNSDIALLPAGFIPEVARSPELLDLAAKHLQSICYTGGDVADCHGDAVSARVKLWNIAGATEFSTFPALRPVSGQGWDRSLWKYVMPHPEMGVDFRCYSWDGGDAKYEAVIGRNSNPEYGQSVFTVYPQLHEYHTGDLYSPHPTIPGLWRYRGRADDCFVLVTGSNVNPLAMEGEVVAHPEVKAALMLGQRRPRPALLVELGRDVKEEEKPAIIEKLWPVIQAGNKNYYDLAKITRERVLFTSAARPMRRTPKGTVQRRPTLDVYKAEIDKMYGPI